MAPRPIRRLDFDELDPVLRDALSAKVARLGYLGEFFAVGGHQPRATAAFQAFTEALKAALPSELTEVVALTIAASLDNRYELNQHEQLAAKLGFSLPWVEAAIGIGDPSELSDDARAARRLAIAVLEDHGHGAAEELGRAVDALGEDQAVAVLLTVGRYVAHAVVSNTLELQPPVESLTSTRPVSR